MSGSQPGTVNYWQLGQGQPPHKAGHRNKGKKRKSKSKRTWLFSRVESSPLDRWTGAAIGLQRWRLGFLGDRGAGEM